jgi:hypothetical protein
MFPEGYYNDQYGIYLCDLAGFGDTRGIEENICTSILTDCYEVYELNPFNCCSNKL